MISKFFRIFVACCMVFNSVIPLIVNAQSSIVEGTDSYTESTSTSSVIVEDVALRNTITDDSGKDILVNDPKDTLDDATNADPILDDPKGSDDNIKNISLSKSSNTFCSDPDPDDGFEVVDIDVQISEVDEEGFKYADVVCTGEGFPEGHDDDEVYYQLVIVSPVGESRFGSLNNSADPYYQTAVFNDIRISGAGTYNFMCKAWVQGDEKPLCAQEVEIELECREVAFELDLPGTFTDGESIFFNEDGSLYDGASYAGNPYDIKFTINRAYGVQDIVVNIYEGTDSTGNLVTTITNGISCAASISYTNCSITDFPTYLPYAGIYYAEIVGAPRFGFCDVEPIGFVTGYKSVCNDVLLSPSSIVENSDTTVQVTCDGYAQEWKVYVAPANHQGSAVFSVTEPIEGSTNVFEFDYSNFTDSSRTNLPDAFDIYCIHEGQSDYIRFYSESDTRGICRSPFEITREPESTCVDTIASVIDDTTITVSCDGSANIYTIDVFQGETEIQTNIPFLSNDGSIDITVPGSGEYTVSCKTLDVNEDSCPEVVVIIPEDNQALCTEATVINPAITVGSSESFSITCEGVNTDTYSLVVLQDGQRVTNLTNSTGEFSYNPDTTTTTNYEFICIAGNLQGGDQCEAITGIVVDESVIECLEIKIDPTVVQENAQGDITIKCIGTPGVSDWSVLVDGTTILAPTEGPNVFIYSIDNLGVGIHTFECVAENDTSTNGNSECVNEVEVTPVNIECIEYDNFLVDLSLVQSTLTDSGVTLGGPITPTQGVEDIVVTVFSGLNTQIVNQVVIYSGTDITISNGQWSVNIHGLSSSQQYYAWIDVIPADGYCGDGTDQAFTTLGGSCVEVAAGDFDVTTPNTVAVGNVLLEGTVGENIDSIEVEIVGESGIYPAVIENGIWILSTAIPVRAGINTYKITVSNDCSRVSKEFKINGTQQSCEDDESYQLFSYGIEFIDGGEVVESNQNIEDGILVVSGYVVAGQAKNVVITINGELLDTYTVPAGEDTFEFDIPLEVGVNDIKVLVVTQNGAEICSRKPANIVVNYLPTEIVCSNIQVSPSTTIVAGSTDDFVVTCEGDGVTAWNVSYSNPTAGVAIIDIADDLFFDQFTISKESLLVGEEYTVICIAENATSNTITPENCKEKISVTGAVCEDQIEFFTLSGQQPNPIITPEETVEVTGTVDAENTAKIVWAVKYNTNAGAVYASGEVTVFDGDTYTFDAPIIQNLEVISYVWVNPVPNDELCSVIFGKDITFQSVNSCPDRQVGTITLTSDDDNNISTDNRTDITVTTTFGFAKRLVIEVFDELGNIVSRDSAIVLGTEYEFENIIISTLGQSKIIVTAFPLDSEQNVIEGCFNPSESIIVSYSAICEEGIGVDIISTSVDSQNLTTTDSIFDLKVETTTEASKTIKIVIVDDQNQTIYEGEFVREGQVNVFTGLPLVVGDNRVVVTISLDGCNEIKKTPLVITRTEPINPVCEPTQVTPSTLVSNTNGEFQIVCEGNSDIIGFTVEYTVPQANGTFATGTIPTAPVVVGNTQTFTYSDTDIVGTYTFSCVGWTLDPDPIKEEVQCGSDTGVVINPTGGQCPAKFKLSPDDLTLEATVNTGTNTALIVGSYDMTNPAIAGVTYLGEDVTIEFIDQRGTFEIVVNLVEGENTFNFQLRSLYKNLACSADTTVVVDYSTSNAVCSETVVNPGTIVNPNSNGFEIVCEGDNVAKFMVDFQKPDGTTGTLANLDDSDYTFDFTDVSAEGTYTFECRAWSDTAATDPVLCGPATGVVDYPELVCLDEDKVRNLTITSPVLNNGQKIVFDRSVVVAGTVEGDAQTVMIMVGDAAYTAQVNRNSAGVGVWTQEVILSATSDFSQVTVTAKSNDLTCGTDSETFTIKYIPTTGGECPADQQVSASDLTLEAEVISGVTTTVITGSYLIDGPVGFVTYNGQQVAVEFIDNRAVFALPVVLQNGTNEFVFTIQPKSTDTDCNPVNETLTLTYPPIVTQCLETEQVTLTFENLPTNNLFNTVAYQFTGVVNGTGNLSGLTINNTPVVVADDGTFVVSGVFAAEGSHILQFAIVANDLLCNDTQTLTIVYDDGFTNGGECEEIRALDVIESSTSVNNSVNSYEFNGSFLTRDLAGFTITQNGNTLSSSDIILSTVSGSTKTNFRTVTTLVEGRNTFVFTATSTDSDEICNDSETITVTRNTTSNGGSGGGGRTSSILCGNGRLDNRSSSSREQCDDGNTRSGDGCSSTCQIEEEPVCGNGVIEIGEMCDDSNTTSGDGCNSTCDIEDAEIKKEIIKERIKQTIRTRRPVALGYVPPKVLPKTGNTSIFAKYRTLLLSE